MINEYNSLKKKLIKNEFKNLNSAQLDAVLTSKGALLILAGAGSGKTTTVVNKIAYLLKYGDCFDNSSSLPSAVNESFITYMKTFADGGFPPDDYIVDVIKNNPVSPYNILAFTFTNKAANEMKERISNIAGDIVSDMWIGTFHSICVKILRRNIEKLDGYSSNFVIYDTADQITLIKMCLSRLGFSEKEFPPKEVLGCIGRAKDNLIEPEEFCDTADTQKTQDIGSIYKVYQKYLKENNAVDFDDIINLTVNLLIKYPEVKNYYSEKFLHVLVDEYQDTNRAQYELIALLSSHHKNLCVVGDDDQSIYGWRGADIRNIINFEDTFNGCKVIRLEQNYRSTANILNAANSIISNNQNRKGKTLWTTGEDGEKISCFVAADDRDEAYNVVSKIDLLTREKDALYSDFAILYRTHSQSRVIEDTFIRNGIPYNIIGGLRFYERKEIKDILAYLKLIVNPSDNVSFKRIINFPKRGIGNKTVEHLENISANNEISMYNIASNPDFPQLSKNKASLLEFSNVLKDLADFSKDNPADEVIKHLLEKIPLIKEYEKEGEVDAKTRIDNIEELVSMAVELKEKENIVSLEEFLEYSSLITDTDISDEKSSNQITLMTVHAAKGLEYPYVFIVGLEEGLFPKTDFFTEDASKIEEERRLCYVAITRAKKRLYISRATRRLSFGRIVQNDPSRFIAEFPKNLISVEGTELKPAVDFASTTSKYKPTFAKYTPPQSKADTFVDTKEYTVGTKVFHKKFGTGKIAKVDVSEKMTILQIDFEKFGRKNIISTVVEIL